MNRAMSAETSPTTLFLCPWHELLQEWNTRLSRRNQFAYSIDHCDGDILCSRCDDGENAFCNNESG